MADQRESRAASSGGEAEAERDATARARQRDQTRARLIDVAVDVLIEQGVARTTTLEVQTRAGVSRGALLHHFPTHAELLSATVSRLVRMNEQAIWRQAERLAGVKDPVERAIRTLADAFSSPSFAAELELWAIARADQGLRDRLREAEREARDSRDRVLAKLFAPLARHPRALAARELSVELLRGLALSGILRADTRKRDDLTRRWIELVQRELGTLPSDH